MWNFKFVGLSLLNVEFSADPYCPMGWTSFQGSCYQLLHENHNFYTGILACNDIGGIMAVINAPEEKVAVWVILE